MKNSIALLSLGLIIAGCTAQSQPAPFELRGGKFYGKNPQNSEYIDHYEGNDSGSNYVYKGRSGSGSSSSTYSEPDYSAPYSSKSSSEITKEPLDSGISSSKLAPPPKFESETPKPISRTVDDHIDRYEDERLSAKSSAKNTASMRVPTSRDAIDSAESPAPKSSKSSDYLNLSNLDKKPAEKAAERSFERTVQSTPAPSAAPSAKGYVAERSDKLSGVFPKEKPRSIDDSEEASELASSHKPETKVSEPTEKPTVVTQAAEEAEASDVRNRALMNISAKEKPRALEIADNEIQAREKPVAEPKEEPRHEQKAEVKEPEVKHEPKVEAKVEAPKVEAKAEPKPKPAAKPAETALSSKEENSGYLTLPDKTPPVAKPAPAKKTEPKAEAKTEPKPEPEVKKVELKEAKPEEKLEITSDKEPEPKKQDIATIPKMEPASTNNPAKFIRPVDGKIIQEFSSGNDGIRIQAAEGTAVKAANGGEVVYSGSELKGYGNMIVIKHPNGFLTAYSHLQDLNVKKGEKVTQGEVIGAVGKTGNVQSPQLHFGVRKGRNAVNPRDYIN